MQQGVFWLINWYLDERIGQNISKEPFTQGKLTRISELTRLADISVSVRSSDSVYMVDELTHLADISVKRASSLPM